VFSLNFLWLIVRAIGDYSLELIFSVVWIPNKLNM